ncbi:MAG: hypothetical protein ACOCZ8_00650 [Bacteroidota bacterium]
MGFCKFGVSFAQTNLPMPATAPAPQSPLNSLKQKQPLVLVAILLITSVAFLFALERITLHTADLGRHLMNGKMVLEQGNFIRTNTYSYTQPDQPVVTHHWGTGVIFYVVHSVAGYKGLSLVYALSAALGVLFMLLAARQVADWWLVLPIAAALLPLYAGRAEVRPEGFSFLLFGLFAWLMMRFRGRKFPKWLFPTLVALQVVWVNLHLFFILGVLFAGLLWLESLIKKDHQHRQWLILWLALGAACFVNPWFAEGAIQPLTILNEYGYDIAENKSVMFMQNRAIETQANAIKDGNLEAKLPDTYYRYWHLHILAVLAGLLWLVAVFRKGLLITFAPSVLLLCFMGLAYSAIRGLPLLSLAAIPALAWLATALGLRGSKTLRTLKIFGAVALAGVCLLVPNQYFSALQYREITIGEATKRRLWSTGFGLYELKVANTKVIDQERAGRFMRENKVPGPIFNNDNGSYLIWMLYPEYKVFVDNRPEAYSVEFFKEIYKPMQADEAVWERQSRRYGIQSIVFYRHDMTEWGQAFLVNRAKDVVNWAPIYIDDFTIIFVRRTTENMPLIRQHEGRERVKLMQYRTEGERKLQQLLQQQREDEQRKLDSLDLSVPEME